MEATRVQAVSRFVPSVTSPPAHTRTGPRSTRVGSVSVRAEARGRVGTTGAATRGTARAESARALSAERPVRAAGGGDGAGAGVGAGVARGPHATATASAIDAAKRL